MYFYACIQLYINITKIEYRIILNLIKMNLYFLFFKESKISIYNDWAIS